MDNIIFSNSTWNNISTKGLVRSFLSSYSIFRKTTLPDTIMKIVDLLIEKGLTDECILKSISEYFFSTKYYNMHKRAFKKDRWYSRIRGKALDITYLLGDEFKPERILDIGCSEGYITKELGSYYEVEEEYLAGITFSIPHGLYTEGIKLVEGKDLEEGKVDLVTAFMVLHHIRESANVIDLICKTLKTGGKFIIREHCIGSSHRREQNISYLKIVHALYSCVLTNPIEESPEEFLSEDKSYYKSKTEWISLIEEKGFRFIYSTKTEKSRLSFYAVFEKL